MEFVRLKRRPMPLEVGRSFTGLNWPLPKHLCLGYQTKTSPTWHSNNFAQDFPIKTMSNSSKSTTPYFYRGGFVAVYLSKIAATMVVSSFDNVNLPARRPIITLKNVESQICFT